MVIGVTDTRIFVILHGYIVLDLLMKLTWLVQSIEDWVSEVSLLLG